MTIIVEDGSIVADANSYISTEDAQTFIDARGLTAVITDGLLLRAMDVLNNLDYIGYRTSGAQVLSFPRSEPELYNTYDYVYRQQQDRPLLVSDKIPAEVINAQVWAAYYIEQGSDPASIPSAGVISEKIDVIEIEYKDSQVLSGVTVATMPNVHGQLRWLLRPSKRSTGRH